MFFRYLFFFILMALSCVTFNARGLMDMGKFERVKEKCKGEDVIALQETNWKESVMRTITRNGKGIFYITIGMEGLEEEWRF